MTADVAPSGKLITVGAPGPRNARLTDDGLRLYHWPATGQDVPSVTTVRRLAGIPHSLHQWSINQVVDRVIDNVGAIRAQLGDPRQLDDLRSWLRAAATDERDRRGSLGTAVHDAAAMGRSLVDVSPEVAPFLRQYYAWLATSRAEVVLAERQVWNLTAGYAGTFDLIARFPDGSLWMVDLKTGSGLYSDHGLQLAAYRYAEFVSRSAGTDGGGLEDVVDEEATALLRAVSGTAVLHLSAKRWEFHSLLTGPDEIAAYLGLLRFAVWSHEHPDVASFSLGSRKGAA